MIRLILGIGLVVGVSLSALAQGVQVIDLAPDGTRSVTTDQSIPTPPSIPDRSQAESARGRLVLTDEAVSDGYSRADTVDLLPGDRLRAVVYDETGEIISQSSTITVRY